MSQHAWANAIDVSGFTLANGQTVTVAKDWDDGTARAKFLEDVRDGACRIFHAVLSPDYDAVHKTHFHLDMGPYRMCRGPGDVIPAGIRRPGLNVATSAISP